jgi:hypothetical protein
LIAVIESLIGDIDSLVIKARIILLGIRILI